MLSHYYFLDIRVAYFGLILTLFCLKTHLLTFLVKVKLERKNMVEIRSPTGKFIEKVMGQSFILRLV